MSNNSQIDIHEQKLKYICEATESNACGLLKHLNLAILKIVHAGHFATTLHIMPSYVFVRTITVCGIRPRHCTVSATHLAS